MSAGIDLDDPAALDAAVVGRKAARLAELRAAGFHCPPGLVLPAGAAQDQEAAFAAAAAARWPGPVAVRTSAVWEDHATSAHAGEGRTVLGATDAEQIAAAVRTCRTAPLPGRDPGQGVAVLVQPLLQPDNAGAAFSADPLTGDRDAVRIAGAPGLGDRLLEGEVVGSDATVRAGVVAGDRGGLTDDDLRAVARVAREVADLFGEPQDVEWALVDGLVHVLQARPISVLPVEPTYPEGNGWEKDVAHYSEPLTPFGWSALAPITQATAEVFPASGFMLDGLEEHHVGGEVYSRVVPAVGSADPGRMPPPPAFVLGLLARLHPTLRARTRAAERLLTTDLTDRWIAAWVDEARERIVTATHRLRDVDLASLDDDTLLEHLAELQALAVDGGRHHFRVFIPYVLALHDLHRRLEHLPGWTAADTAGLLTGTSPATRTAEEELTELRRDVRARDGCVDALRARPHDPVGVLARDAPGLAGALEAWLAAHAGRALNYDAGAPVLAEKPTLVTRLLLATERDDHAPSDERDEPSTTVHEVRERLDSESERAAFDRALARARACHPWREDTVILGGDAVLGLQRRWLREAGARLVDRQVVGAVQDAAYLTADELAAVLRDRLAAPDAQALITRRRGEEAWVRMHPGPPTIGHHPPPPDLSALPPALRQVNEAALWMVGLEYPAEATGQDPATAADPAAEADGGAPRVRGIGASPGSAQGTVRIVHDHTDLERLVDGDVLVCRVASPAWVPVFSLCAAVVADGGGALSHAAIAAREHRLPAVLGTRDATTVLRDGDRVQVDGATGTVAVL